MTVAMTGNIDRVEVITSVQRRRRWSAEEKARIVQETYAPGMSVSLVARQHGVAPNQLFTCGGCMPRERCWRSGQWCPLPNTALCSTSELQRLLGKKTLENEILREVLDLVQPKKRLLRHPLPRGTARREGDIRYAQGGALQSSRASSTEADPKAPGPSATARGSGCHRDQGADRRSTDLWVSTHPCAAPASAPRTGRYGSERQAGLPGHESAPSSVRPPHRERRGTAARGPHRGRPPRCALVLGRVRDRLRQRRESAHRLHAGLLRPRGDLLGGDNRRHRQLRHSRPDGRKRRAPLRAGRQIAPADRVAVGQRLALYCRRNPRAGAIYRLGAVHDTDPKPPIERHG